MTPPRRGDIVRPATRQSERLSPVATYNETNPQKPLKAKVIQHMAKKKKAAKKKTAKRKSKGKKATGDLIISKSRTKAAAKINVSGDFYGALDGVVRGMIKSAEKRAQDNGRKTLRPHDL